MYSIGDVAKATGIKVPTIRFYEQEGLLPAPPRTTSGRRVYSDIEVRRLTFIRRARGLGFELDDIRSLLDLADQPDLPCDDADTIASQHLGVIEDRLRQLTALKAELTRIVKSCGGHRVVGECRVIEALTDHA